MPAPKAPTSDAGAVRYERVADVIANKLLAAKLLIRAVGHVSGPTGPGREVLEEPSRAWTTRRRAERRHEALLGVFNKGSHLLPWRPHEGLQPVVARSCILCSIRAAGQS